jgi:Fe-S cluster assembly protein SufD
MTPVDRLAALGPPTRDLEDWRHVDLAPLATGFPEGQARIDLGQAPPGVLIVDGRVQVAPHQATAEVPGIDVATCDDHMRLWALAGGSAGIRVSDGAATVHIHATGGTSAWRLHVAVPEGVRARLNLRTSHAAAVTGARQCGFLSVAVGRGAALVVDQRDLGRLCQALTTIAVSLEADAQATWTSQSSGGAFVRCRVDADLRGRGASWDLACLDHAGSAGQSHRLTRTRHLVGEARSRQVLKLIADGTASTSCDALIAVAAGADGTDADLQNRNLLLSTTAKAATRPQLDIRADEVSAAHGATIGRFDAEEETYLRLRGLTPADARRLLTDAFIAEVAARV